MGPFKNHSYCHTFSKPLPNVHLINSYTLGNFNEDSDAGNYNTDIDDNEDTNLNLVYVCDVLSTSVISDTANDNFSLPSHITCCAHSLNLIATRDIFSIDDNKYNKISESSFQKLQSFWNLLSMSTVASDKVFEICDCKFPIPIMTRWNSLFDTAKKVLLHKTKII